MKSYISREIIKILKDNGWEETGESRGSNHYFINLDKPESSKVTVPHPRKDIPIAILKFPLPLLNRRYNNDKRQLSLSGDI